MSEGKYVEQIYRDLCAMDEDEVAKAGPVNVLVALANVTAREHPVQYERFRIGSFFVRLWRWVISATWSRRSRRRGASNANVTAGGGGYGDG